MPWTPTNDPASADTTVFRLAHLSDLHLAEEPASPGWHQSSGVRGHLGISLRVISQLSMAPVMTSHDGRCLRALMDALTGLNPYTAPGYDGILITGDIATTGAPNDMKAAAGMLRREDGVAGGESFDGPLLPSEKVILLPGNHDRYFGRGLSPMSTQFEKNFGSNWSLGSPAPGEDRPDVNEKILHAVDGTQLAIVSGDFSFTSPSVRWLRMVGRGRARAETLEKMVSLTARYASKQIAVVWAVHFPPVKQGVQSTLRLERHEEVIQAAAKCGVHIIFCGHTHIASPSLMGYFDSKSSAVQIVCAASACEYVKPDSNSQRSYFEVQLEVMGENVRLKRPPIEMIYSRWLDRSPETDGRAAIFCPAP